MVENIEASLWDLRIKLAAAVSRLRIAHNALSLTDMLPYHLRNERKNKFERKPLTLWVNKCRFASPSEIIYSLATEIGYQLAQQDEPLIQGNYMWDALCPMFLCFHKSQRENLCESSFVRDHKLILQDISFAYGPATLGKILLDLKLSGAVVLTHVTSPRTTAYVAAVLSQNESITSLLAFGAGERKTEFESYFNGLGINNVLLYSKPFCEMDLDNEIFDNVMAVLATPPNSYSAVADPIELVCGRGGDLLMLEVLTDHGRSKEGERRIMGMLEQQRLTLTTAMSKPQVQVVLYETHSQLSAENEDMVCHVIREVNNSARRLHSKAAPAPIPQYALATNQLKEINNNDPEEEETEKSDEPPEAEKKDYQDYSNVQVGIFISPD